MKYYAVRRGRTPGIYGTWTECQAQIYQFSGAIFKAFEDLDAAEDYLTQDAAPPPINSNLPFAYIDGSYSSARSVYGYGGFIEHEGSRHIIQGTGRNPQYLPERNIAGETIGALQVMFTAQRCGIEEINLFFDYAGIENWAAGSWKARTPLAQYYKQTADIMADYVSVHFIKVEGHAGIIGNELADLLAKEAVGARLRKKDIATLEAFRAGGISF